MTKYNPDMAMCRIDAYIRMLEEAYQADDATMAEMVNVDPEEWAEFKQAGPDGRSALIAFDLAKITGIDLDWLFAAIDYEAKRAERTKERKEIAELTDLYRRMSDKRRAVLLQTAKVFVD